MARDLTFDVLRAYPQIYHACHTRHSRARTSAHRLSARDAWIIGHLDVALPISPTDLARHLALSPSTLSEALKRLEGLGYVVRRSSKDDRRRIEIRLAPLGVAAIKGASVLDARRVRRLLAQLPEPQRSVAVNGLSELARAARALNAKEPKQWNERDQE